MAFFGNKTLVQEKDALIDQLQRENTRLNDEKVAQEDLVTKLSAETTKLKKESTEKDQIIERLQESLRQTEHNLIYSRDRCDSLKSTIKLQEEEITKLKDFINEQDERYYTISINDYIDLGLRRFSPNEVKLALDKIRKEIEIRNQEEIERKETITQIVKLLAEYNNQRYAYIIRLINVLDDFISSSTRKTNAIFTLMYSEDQHQLAMMKRKMLESVRVKDVCLNRLYQS